VNLSTGPQMVNGCFWEFEKDSENVRRGRLAGAAAGGPSRLPTAPPVCRRPLTFADGPARSPTVPPVCGRGDHPGETMPPRIGCPGRGGPSKTPRISPDRHTALVCDLAFLLEGRFVEPSQASAAPPKPPTDSMRAAPSRSRPRQAVATVELAICLPLVFALAVATIDLCSAMFLKESLTIAAYEGARAGSPKGGTNADAIARVTALLDDRDITYDAGQVVTISGDGFDDAETLDHVTLTVQVPAAGNLLSATQFFRNANLQARVTMRKEYGNE